MKVITVNKKAFFDYEIIEKLEAGLELVGSEVKSLREGRVNLKDSFVEVRGQQAFLIHAHISPYPNASYNNHEPERVRRLLLHHREIHRLDQKVRAKGVTIMPLRLYFNDQGRAKIEIGLARGKREYEKKQKIKEKDVKREIDRDMRHFKKR